MSARYPDVYIHPTAIVAADAIGPGTKIWAFCNLLEGSRVGAECQICDRVFIENGVTIGDRVTIKCGVSLWKGVVLEEGVFVGPEVAFSNDVRPRSRRHLAEHPITRVERFASLGSGSVFVPGVTIGAYALVGAGAVVTRDVAPHSLVVGNPARHRAWVCVCGARLTEGVCSAGCGRTYTFVDGVPSLATGHPDPAETS